MFVGVIPLFDVNAKVLFDSGTTHSFLASSFVQTHKLEVTKDTKGWYISIPTGINQVAEWVCKRCPITLGHLTLPATMIVLEMKDFDIILGMYWMSKYYAFIDCRHKKVIFEIPGEGTCYYEGIRSQTPEAVSTRFTCMLAETSNEG